MWYYISPVGTFSITPEPNGEYTLWIDNDKLGTYIGPDAAAETVRQQITSFSSWDNLAEASPPQNLAGWMYVRDPR